MHALRRLVMLLLVLILLASLMLFLLANQVPVTLALPLTGFSWQASLGVLLLLMLATGLLLGLLAGGGLALWSSRQRGGGQ